MNEQEQANRIPANDNVALLTVVKVIAVLVLVYPLLHYSFLQREAGDGGVQQEQVTNDTQPPINETVDDEIQEVALPVKRVVIEQPSCPLSYLRTVLQELCRELFLQHQQCTPEDVNNLEKHKLPPKRSAKNNTTGEPRGTIVGCVAAGLLLTSLGAAFLELYKAKSQTPIKAKPPMSRKCSLADLTVLKHNRKELVRRESIMEIPENGGPLKPLGRKVSRPPLRLD